MTERKDGSESGFQFRIGTYEDALKMVGAKGQTVEADIEVNAPMIQYYCATVEDGNPSYWSEEFARTQWGGLVAPPSMLQSWLLPLPWRPEGARVMRSVSIDVPLPGDKPINVSSDAEFFLPIRVGDRLSSTDELIAVSEEKQTKIGTGHFVTSRATIRNQRGEIVGRVTNILFRYKSQGSPA